ncbi:hypothetical protein MSG28_007072 [Choristoneura fumiferana]|uniref:Uncharacterized protein n=1 Tax=Choristoneura fumiferana TaxID=7141 RepID=A0ACC0JMJ1_CHOFU|nr:hypothetical protein MSG28_007072 [Choristoneura fumiferana]
MLADGEIVGDGSWNLTVYVTDLSEKRTMVVKGDMHIGGVMLKLTESFAVGVNGTWRALCPDQNRRLAIYTGRVSALRMRRPQVRKRVKVSSLRTNSGRRS